MEGIGHSAECVVDEDLPDLLVLAGHADNGCVESSLVAVGILDREVSSDPLSAWQVVLELEVRTGKLELACRGCYFLLVGDFPCFLHQFFVHLHINIAQNVLV